MKKQKGFSLIELLIVVAIILIIAAIAIPNLLKSRMAANESSAVGSIRTINTAEVTFAGACPNVGFALLLVDLNTGGGCAGGIGIIDQVLSSGTKSGYKFTAVGAPSAGSAINTVYTTDAQPLTPNVTGVRGFFSDQTGVIRNDQSGVATVASTPLQ